MCGHQEAIKRSSRGAAPPLPRPLIPKGRSTMSTSISMHSACNQASSPPPQRPSIPSIRINQHALNMQSGFLTSASTAINPFDSNQSACTQHAIRLAHLRLNGHQSLRFEIACPHFLGHDDVVCDRMHKQLRASCGAPAKLEDARVASVPVGRRGRRSEHLHAAGQAARVASVSPKVGIDRVEK